MNCSLCGLPQDTGALGSVLPQCICHWKHTPYQGAAKQTEYEFNIERLKELLKQQKAEIAGYKFELELHKAMIQDLERQSKPIGVYDGKNVHICAPQTKPLSDEEIIAMADSLSLIHYYDADGEWSGITNEPMFRAEQNRNNERLLEILKPFARAIEERHGIK